MYHPGKQQSAASIDQAAPSCCRYSRRSHDARPPRHASLPSQCKQELQIRVYQFGATLATMPRILICRIRTGASMQNKVTRLLTATTCGQCHLPLNWSMSRLMIFSGSSRIFRTSASADNTEFSTSCIQPAGASREPKDWMHQVVQGKFGTRSYFVPKTILVIGASWHSTDSSWQRWASKYSRKRPQAGSILFGAKISLGTPAPAKPRPKEMPDRSSLRRGHKFALRSKGEAVGNGRNVPIGSSL